MGLLNVACTLLLVATPLTGGALAAGEVAVTVGGTLSTGGPKIGSSPPPPPPPQPNRSNARSIQNQAIGDRTEGLRDEFMNLPSCPSVKYPLERGQMRTGNSSIDDSLKDERADSRHDDMRNKIPKNFNSRVKSKVTLDKPPADCKLH
jgi:hypothetical protein